MARSKPTISKASSAPKKNTLPAGKSSLFSRIDKPSAHTVPTAPLAYRTAKSNSSGKGNPLSDNALFLAISGSRRPKAHTPTGPARSKPNGITGSVAKNHTLSNTRSINSALLGSKQGRRSPPAKAKPSKPEGSSQKLFSSSSSRAPNSSSNASKPVSDRNRSQKPVSNSSSSSSRSSRFRQRDPSPSRSGSSSSHRNSSHSKSSEYYSSRDRRQLDERGSQTSSRSTSNNPQRATNAPSSHTSQDTGDYEILEQNNSGTSFKEAASVVIPANSGVNSFSIRHASLPPILVLRNLAAGTSTADVRTVCANIGIVSQCRTQVQLNNSVMAEIVFQDRNMATLAAQQFDGADADGQIIQAEVTKLQTIPTGGTTYAPSPSTAATGASQTQTQLSRAASTSSQGGRAGFDNSWEGPPMHSDMLVVRRSRPIIRQ